MKIRRLVGTLALVLGALLGVSACDNRPCLNGHYDYMPMLVGKTVTIVPEFVCDHYGSEATAP